jgi:hypothetical protein
VDTKATPDRSLAGPVIRAGELLVKRLEVIGLYRNDGSAIVVFDSSFRLTTKDRLEAPG